MVTQGQWWAKKLRIESRPVSSAKERATPVTLTEAVWGDWRGQNLTRVCLSKNGRKRTFKKTFKASCYKQRREMGWEPRRGGGGEDTFKGEMTSLCADKNDPEKRKRGGAGD